MEGTTPKIGKFSLNYGLLLGLISTVFSIMLMTADMHYERDWTITAIGIVILAIVVAIGINSFKKANGGLLSLAQALKLGTGIALVAGVIGLVYYGLLTNDIIEEGFMEKATEIAKAETFASNPNLTEEQWEQGLEMQKSFAWLAYPFILIFQAIAGFVAGLIFGLIMKKEEAAY